jgi:hypothetical protein
MEKHFVPYNQALALKEIGFDVPCLYSYYQDGTIASELKSINWNLSDTLCSAPIKSQVFEWFREKHNLLNEISFYRCDRRTKKAYWFTIFKWDDAMVNREIIRDKSDTYYFTYDDAEFACIDKLIELVKNGR